MNDKISARIKPRKCPKCGCSPIASILYGMPAFSPKLEMELDEGTIVLGGCCITDNDPEWQCVGCGIQIYREENVFN